MMNQWSRNFPWTCEPRFNLWKNAFIYIRSFKIFVQSKYKLTYEYSCNLRIILSFSLSSAYIAGVYGNHIANQANIRSKRRHFFVKENRVSVHFSTFGSKILVFFLCFCYNCCIYLQPPHVFLQKRFLNDGMLQ